NVSVTSFPKPATVNRELACLKAMLNHALKERHDFRNPVSEVDFLAENNEQTRVLTFEEQRKYLDSASNTLKDRQGGWEVLEEALRSARRNARGYVVR